MCITTGSIVFMKFLFRNLMLITLFTYLLNAKELRTLSEAAIIVSSSDTSSELLGTTFEAWNNNVLLRTNNIYLEYNPKSNEVTHLACPGLRELESVATAYSSMPFASCITRSATFFHRTLFGKIDGKWMSMINKSRKKVSFEALPKVIEKYTGRIKLLGDVSRLIVLSNEFIAIHDNTWQIIKMKTSQKSAVTLDFSEMYQLHGNDILIAKGFGEYGGFVKKINLVTGEWEDIGYFDHSGYVANVLAMCKDRNSDILVLQGLINWGDASSQLSKLSNKWEKIAGSERKNIKSRPVFLTDMIVDFEGNVWYLLKYHGLAMFKKGVFETLFDLHGLSKHILKMHRVDKTKWLFYLTTGDLALWDSKTGQMTVSKLYKGLE